MISHGGFLSQPRVANLKLACEQLTYFRSSLLSLRKLTKQDTPTREVARSHSSCILSFELIGQHQNKRLYVTEIVLPLGFAYVNFRRERRTTGNTSDVQRLNRGYYMAARRYEISLRVLKIFHE